MNGIQVFPLKFIFRAITVSLVKVFENLQRVTPGILTEIHLVTVLT